MQPSPEGKNLIARFGLTHLLPGFLKRREQEVVDLRELLKISDFETVRRLGHSLKGSGANYGFDDLTDVGSRIETAALENNLALCTSLVDEYAQILAKITASG